MRTMSNQEQDGEPRRSMRLKHAVAWVIGGGLVGQAASVVAVQISLSVAGAETQAEIQKMMGKLPVLAPALLVSSGTLLLIALLAPLAHGLKPKRALALRSAPATTYVAAVVGTLALAPVADFFMSWAQRLAPDFTFGAVDSLHDLASTSPPLLLWPLLALMPGLGEELLFRGLLQRAARRGMQAILISGVGFAAFHVDPHHVAGVLPLGLFFAWVAERTGSTVVTVVAHIANNSASIAATRVSELDVGYGTEQQMPISWVIVGFAVSMCCAWLIARETRHQAQPG